MGSTESTVFFAAAVWGPGRAVAPGRIAVDGQPGAQVVVEVTAADRPRPGDVAIDGLVAPGLVDLHCHIGRGWGPFAVDPAYQAQAGVTACCAQGDVGTTNVAGWLRDTAGHGVRTYLALNLAPRGEVGGPSSLRGLVANDAARVVAVARRHPETVTMISVNLGRRSLGDEDPLRVLTLAIEAADAAGLPLMVGLAEADRASLEEQLALLRAGDVVTYAFRSAPWSLMHAGQPIDAVHEARRRGVLFDASHGLNSFDPRVARAAIATGLVPDSVSSDLQAVDGGASLPLPSVLSKIVHAGLPVEDALLAATRAPAIALGLPAHVGDLVAGASRDLAVLHGPVHAWRGTTLLADGVLTRGPALDLSARVVNPPPAKVPTSTNASRLARSRPSGTSQV